MPNLIDCDETTEEFNRNRKVSNIRFKPEQNQPYIDTFTKTLSVGSSNPSTTRLTVQTTPIIENSRRNKDLKKRSPPTPPDNQNPQKKYNMESSSGNENDTIDNNGNPAPAPTPDVTDPEPELSGELKQLLKLLNEDMAKMIDPLKVSISELERSNKKLEAKGEMISTIKSENDRLHTDYRKLKSENKKDRITAMENKLLENNIVIQGVPDQAWELSENTREKALIAISHIANGKTPQEKCAENKYKECEVCRRI